jgi:hypothetical protein
MPEFRTVRRPRETPALRRLLLLSCALFVGGAIPNLSAGGVSAGEAVGSTGPGAAIDRTTLPAELDRASRLLVRGDTDGAVR